MPRLKLTISLLILLMALLLRLIFIHTTQLYPDEFVTLLAISMIGEHGLPRMPSGLFYEHGLLYSYLGHLASLLGKPRWAARYLSLICGLLTLSLITRLGHRYISWPAALLALSALAIAPAAIEWSGRVRMYALLQLLILLTLWLAYEGLAHNRPRYRWAALLSYLAATLTHFVAVALAPPLALASLLLTARPPLPGGEGRGEGQQTPPLPSKAGRGEGQQTPPLPSKAGRGEGQQNPPLPTEAGRGEGQQTPPLPGGEGRGEGWNKITRLWPEALAFLVILLIAFLIKRAGQPKGIAPLQTDNAATGLLDVLTIYSDISLNPWAGWQAISPFYLTMPALIFAPFIIYALLRLPLSQSLTRPSFPTFLMLILLLTTLEMIFLVSPDRRDDKYLFMLLPALFLSGAHGLHQLYQTVAPRKPSGYRLTMLLVGLGMVALTYPPLTARLSNPGDDYDNAFAYVAANWQPGDKILTGTPAAAYFYLGRNDFYSVQKRGGYDYRILTEAGQPVDRWLASPALRTPEALHAALSMGRVWLVLERWGLQREYYDLPFQQQLLAQTSYQAEAQGIFILRSQPDPQPIKLDPEQPLQATFDNGLQLRGYTAEPPRPAPGHTLRLTLYWQATAPLSHNYTVFVHLRPQADPTRTMAQADHRPLGPLYPTSMWPPGETIRETSELTLPADLPAEPYALWVGLYRLETSQRLPLRNDSSGENAVRLPLGE